MKKRLFVFATASIVCGIIFASVIQDNTQIRNAFASNSHTSSCNWNHYNELLPTYNENGVKEYWICCDHPHLGPSLSAPTSGKVTNRSASSDFRKTIQPTDIRYLKPYNEPLDFSDGYLPSILTHNSNVKSAIVTDEGEYKFVVKNGSFGVFLSKYYLDQVFSDSSVVAINFEAKGDFATNNFRRKYYDPLKSAWTNRTYESNHSAYGITQNWKIFTYTREYYDLYQEGKTFLCGGNVVEDNYILIDNITPVKVHLDPYRFENGGIRDTWNFYSPGHSDSGYIYYEAPERIFRAHDDNKGVLTEADYDYDHKSEGRRSIRIGKNNGYVAFYLRNNIQTILGDDDIILFDFMSSIGINSNLTAKNLTDGMNQIGFAPNGVHPGNQWVTYAFTKSNITSDGRFLIVQGSTSGYYYFDNIRIVKNNGYVNQGNIHLEEGEGYSLTTSHNIDRVEYIAINDIEASPSDTNISVSGRTVNLSSALMEEGKITKFLIVYEHNYQLYSNYIFFEPNVFTKQSDVNLSIAYGDSGYHTLSGYSNIYRMTCNGKEVPFEVSGANYLIPKAALIELLETSNNKKVSGKINLDLYSLTAKYRIPFNITVSNNVDVKPIPNYQGEGIKTHAYSFSSELGDQNTYAPYLNTTKIAEYNNVGYEIIYEQRVHVLTDHSKSKNAINFLLDNAQRLGKKVILSEDAFGLFSKQTQSLIGNDVMNGSSVYSHFNSEAELDSFVESRLKLYIDHPACYGVSIGDEQSYDQIVNGFKDIMQSLHRVLTKLGRTDFYLGNNLHPFSASDETLAGANYKTSSDAENYHELNYLTYLNAYLNASGNDYIQFDAYPFADNKKGGNYGKNSDDSSTANGITYFYMANLLLVANFAKENNLELKMVGQSTTYYGTRIIDRKDMAWIYNMMLGMGVKHISSFVYCNRGTSGVSKEGWLDESSPLNGNGERNDHYYLFQSTLMEIQQFSKFISAFDYEWCNLFNFTPSWIESTFQGKVKPNTAYVYEYMRSMSSYSSTKTYGEFSSLTVNQDWVLISGLKAKADGKKMFMIQNVYNNFENELLQNITVTLNGTYNYAVIYESGLPRVVTLNSKTLNLQLSSGRAAFVLVY